MNLENAQRYILENSGEKLTGLAFNDGELKIYQLREWEDEPGELCIALSSGKFFSYDGDYECFELDVVIEAIKVLDFRDILFNDQEYTSEFYAYELLKQEINDLRDPKTLLTDAEKETFMDKCFDGLKQHGMSVEVNSREFS